MGMLGMNEFNPLLVGRSSRLARSRVSHDLTLVSPDVSIPSLVGDVHPASTWSCCRDTLGVKFQASLGGDIHLTPVILDAKRAEIGSTSRFPLGWNVDLSRLVAHDANARRKLRRVSIPSRRGQSSRHSRGKAPTGSSVRSSFNPLSSGTPASPQARRDQSGSSPPSCNHDRPNVPATAC